LALAKTLVKLVGAGEDSGVHIAQGDHYSSGESCGVDEMGAA